MSRTKKGRACTGEDTACFTSSQQGSQRQTPPHCRSDSVRRDSRKAAGSCLPKLHFTAAFHSCISQLHFTAAFHSCISQLHFKAVFQSCISKLHFQAAFPSCISKLHFKAAFQSCRFLSFHSPIQSSKMRARVGRSSPLGLPLCSRDFFQGRVANLGALAPEPAARQSVYICVRRNICIYIYIYIGAPTYRKSRKELSEIFFRTFSFLLFSIFFFSPFLGFHFFFGGEAMSHRPGGKK